MNKRSNIGRKDKVLPEKDTDRPRRGLPLAGHGSAVIEYLTFLAFILAILITMGVYTRRGIQGKWKETIQTVSAGRVYGSKTKDCYYDARARVWADSHCYDAQCLEACSYPQEHEKYGECLGCIRSCGCTP